MTDYIPRASIHVGADKKTFSVQVSNEAERRGWDEKRYQLKNAESDKNNHYNITRKHLNFEITKGGKIIPLGSNPDPLHKRLQIRYEELEFKPYTGKGQQGETAENTPNCVVNIIFGGDHDVMYKLAFGDQQFDPSDPYADQSNIVLKQAIYQWAMDTYRFACHKWGEENIIGFCVHCDETSIHAHVLIVPVAKVKKRGRIGSVYTHKDNPGIKLTTKEWKALPKEERASYTKSEADKDVHEQVSYAKVWGEHAADKSAYLSQLHTDYYDEVGCKYGLERGISYEELSEEEARARVHKNKVVLEAERQSKLAIAEAERQKAEIEAETANIQQQKDEAQKDLKSAQSGFMAKILNPGKHKKEETEKLQTAYNTGVKETIDKIIENTKLKFSSPLSPEQLGKTIRSLWNDKKDLNSKLTAKENEISKKQAEIDNLKADNGNKDAEITKLNAKVTQLTTTVEDLKYRITLIDPYAVDKLRLEKNSEITVLKSQRDEYKSKADAAEQDVQKLKELLNDIFSVPEISDMWDNVQKQRQIAEAKKKAEAERLTKRLDLFIANAIKCIKTFAKDRRDLLSPKDESNILSGILAKSQKDGLDATDDDQRMKATKSLLSMINWKGCTQNQEDFASLRTTQLCEECSGHITKEIIAFINDISGGNGVAMSGGGGVAGELTNWDGTKKNNGWGI